MVVAGLESAARANQKALAGSPGSRRMDADVVATVRAAFPGREVASADVVGPS